MDFAAVVEQVDVARLWEAMRLQGEELPHGRNLER